jgi:hypothetical protein
MEQESSFLLFILDESFRFSSGEPALGFTAAG